MEFLKRYRDIYAVDGDEDEAQRSGSVVSFPMQPPQRGDSAAAALDLVAEAAAAVRGLEEQATEAIVRARHVADALVKKLEIANAQVEDTDNRLQHAEAVISQLMAEAREADSTLSTLQRTLAAKEADLAAAERRADDAEAAIQSIVDAIRAQLPLAFNIPGE